MAIKVSNTTVIDDSRNILNIGIATISTLNVGTGGTVITTTGSGFVGIGTTNPLQKAHIFGNLLVAAGSATTQHITQKAYELNNGTLSWEGTAGQLFSITNNLTSGSIFSVNDVSGIPSIDVDANGTVSMVSYGGSVGIGTTNPSQRLHVQGNVRITGGLFDSNNNVGAANSILISTGAGISWTTAGGGGSLSISTSVVPQFQYLSFVSGASTSILGISTLSQPLVFIPSTGNLGIGTTNPTQKLQVQGNVLVSGASTLGTVQISSGIITASSGIVTYYGDGSQLTGVSAASADSYLFNTGITSSFSRTLVGIGSTIFTFPATAGKEYIVLSINCANVSAGNTEVNVIGAFDFNGGERSYFAYNIPIPTGTSLEIMKQPQVLNPSDAIVMRSTDFNRAGADNIIETYVTYQEKTSTSYFGVGLGAVGLALTSITGIYTSTTFPSVIQSIRLANITDTGSYPVSVQITNGLTTTRLVDNLIVPKYGSVELLDAPKRIEVNSRIEVQLDQGATMGIQVSGSQITS